MNRWLILGFCACLVCVAGSSRAIACECGDCGGVSLSLHNGTVRFVSPGQVTTLSATATDNDTWECILYCDETQEITEFDWSFPLAIQHDTPSDPRPCGSCDSDVEIWSYTPGQYTVNVGAADNDGHYTSSSFTIWVIDLDLDIITSPIGIGDMAEATLSWDPDYPPGCLELCTTSSSGGYCINVYADEGKTNQLLSGVDSYMNMVSRFTHTVWIEGLCDSYSSSLWFYYRPSCSTANPIDDYGEDSVRVVAVGQVEIYPNATYGWMSRVARSRCSRARSTLFGPNQHLRVRHGHPSVLYGRSTAIRLDRPAPRVCRSPLTVQGPRRWLPSAAPRIPVRRLR